MKVYVNDEERALPLVFPNAAELVEPEAFRLGNKRKKMNRVKIKTCRVINLLELVHYHVR